jgi:membrane protease YdiL (CAAX protease family)
MDVVCFSGVLILYIWIVQPATGGHPLLEMVFISAALTIAAVSLRRAGAGPKEMGLRVDNILPALVMYLAASILYAGSVVLWNQGSVEEWGVGWPNPLGVVESVVWAFLQQFCLLAFILSRLRETFDRKLVAVVGAAGLFAFFHLPNPFLTLYTLGGGLIICTVHLRWPNIPAAALGHATASSLVDGLLPNAVTGSMRVGPSFWWTGG